MLKNLYSFNLREYWRNVDKIIFFSFLILFVLGVFFSFASTSSLAGERLNKDYYFLPNAVGAFDNSNAKAAANANRKKIPPTSRYYIRFEKLLDIIENNVVLRVVNGDSFKESKENCAT